MAGYKLLRLFPESEAPFLYVGGGQQVPQRQRGDAAATSVATAAAGAGAGAGGFGDASSKPEPDAGGAAASTRAQRNISAVDVEAPDLARFPLFAHAQGAAQVLLAPGEMLFLPAGHFHHVRALTPSVSVNFWF